MTGASAESSTASGTGGYRHERPLRAILVGAGGMGRAWLRTVANFDDVDLAAVVDIDLERAKQAVAEFGTPDVLVGKDFGAVARTAEADFVIDVTIPEAHHPVTLEALLLGLPVLGEKPLAASLSEALELAAASEAYDRLFMVSQSRRYNEHLFAFRDQIRSLGPLGMLTATFFKAPRFGGFRDAMAHPLVLDMAIHQFDTARFLATAEPTAVFCDEFNPVWSWYAGDAAATAIFELADGSRFVFNGSWCSDGMETSWDSSWRASSQYGTALWNGDDPPQCERTTPEAAAGSSDSAADPADAFHPVNDSADASYPVGAQRFGGYAGLGGSLREFVGALRTGIRPMGEVHDNVMSLAMVYAAIESSLTGQRIQLSDMLEGAHAEALARTTREVRNALAAWTSLTPPGA